MAVKDPRYAVVSALQYVAFRRVVRVPARAPKVHGSNPGFRRSGEIQYITGYKRPWVAKFNNTGFAI